MRSYRLVLLDKRGRVVGNRSLDCACDQEAVAAADRDMAKCEYVEVWDGGRPVCIRAKPPAADARPANPPRLAT